MEDEEIEVEETAVSSPDEAELDQDEDQEDGNQDVTGFSHGSLIQGTKRKEKKEEGTSEKPGIVYLSRIPTMMRPQRMRKIFSQYGEIGRVFLQPEGLLNKQG